MHRRFTAYLVLSATLALLGALLGACQGGYGQGLCAQGSPVEEARCLGEALTEGELDRSAPPWRDLSQPAAPGVSRSVAVGRESLVPFGADERPVLALRCQDSTFELLLLWPHEVPPGRHRLRFALDRPQGGDPWDWREEVWAPGSDGASSFAQDPGDLLGRMLASRAFRLEAAALGTSAAFFPLDGLDRAAVPVAAACGLSLAAGAVPG